MKRTWYQGVTSSFGAEVSETKIILSPRWKSLANSIAHPSASQAVRVTLSAGTSGLIPSSAAAPESSGVSSSYWRVRATERP